MYSREVHHDLDALSGLPKLLTGHLSREIDAHEYKAQWPSVCRACTAGGRLTERPPLRPNGRGPDRKGRWSITLHGDRTVPRAQSLGRLLTDTVANTRFLIGRFYISRDSRWVSLLFTVTMLMIGTNFVVYSIMLPWVIDAHHHQLASSRTVLTALHVLEVPLLYAWCCQVGPTLSENPPPRRILSTEGKPQFRLGLRFSRFRCQCFHTLVFEPCFSLL